MIHFNQKYLIDRDKNSSVQLNGSGTSRGTLPYALSKVSLRVTLFWPYSQAYRFDLLAFPARHQLV
jgi:hypothetical protein